MILHKRGKKEDRALLLFGCESNETHLRAEAKALVQPVRAGTILRVEDPPMLVKVIKSLNENDNLFDPVELEIVRSST